MYLVDESRQVKSLELMELENDSFKNMVLYYSNALMRVNEGVPTSEILSKRDREHMKKIGILILTMDKGKRYLLSDRARSLLREICDNLSNKKNDKRSSCF